MCWGVWSRGPPSSACPCAWGRPGLRSRCREAGRCHPAPAALSPSAAPAPGEEGVLEGRVPTIRKRVPTRAVSGDSCGRGGRGSSRPLRDVPWHRSESFAWKVSLSLLRKLWVLRSTWAAQQPGRVTQAPSSRSLCDSCPRCGREELAGLRDGPLGAHLCGGHPACLPVADGRPGGAAAPQE